jgi:hypothetical protein
VCDVVDSAGYKAWAHERKRPVRQDVFAAVLGDVEDTLVGCGVPHCFIGGVASRIWGRSRPTRDLDLMIAPENAEAVLNLLAARGFDTDLTYPSWLIKAHRDGVVVDLIYHVFDIYFGAEMAGHVVIKPYNGLMIRVVSPEDLLIMKVKCHTVKLRSGAKDNASRHWGDALGVIDNTPLDWACLLERSHLGGYMLLSILIYAQAIGLSVPNSVCATLARRVYGEFLN